MNAARTVLDAARPCPIASAKSRVQLTSYTSPAKPEQVYAARNTKKSIDASSLHALSQPLSRIANAACFRLASAVVRGHTSVIGSANRTLRLGPRRRRAVVQPEVTRSPHVAEGAVLMLDRWFRFAPWVAGALLLPAVIAAQGQGSLAQPTYQLRHWTGQGLAPVYEGWDRNDDGTFNMWFGYMNRNYEETIELPVGAANRFEPGEADRGQPTFFDTRRHKDTFRVVVPASFGENTKLNWSVTVRGKTETVTGTLTSVWQIDRLRTTRGGNSQNINSNTPPVVSITPTTQSVTTGASATLSVSATDDGLPKRRNAQGQQVPMGMTVEWAKYRGPGSVTWSTAKQPVVSGKADVTATFSEPGEYVLLAVVDDGSGESAGNFGYHCCWTNVEVKVTVTGASSARQ